MKYQVQITVDDAGLLAEKLGIEKRDFIAEYTDPRWPGINSYLIRHTEGACIFLQRGDAITSCRIHAFRPQSCREWQPGTDKPECNEGKAILAKKDNK